MFQCPIFDQTILSLGKFESTDDCEIASQVMRQLSHWAMYEPSKLRSKDRKVA